MVWGIGILWFAFAGCLIGLILEFTKENEKIEEDRRIP